MNMEKLDRDIIKFIQDDLPLSRSPYRSWAEAQGISQEEIVARIQTMLKKGIIRRMGAVLRHQKAGYAVNAMVAWKVEESSADKVGEIMAAYKEISHCYWREVPPSFNYPLFTGSVKPGGYCHQLYISQSLCLKLAKFFGNIKGSPGTKNNHN
jgi:DNA-binding Lrp family transcriptional regulator